MALHRFPSKTTGRSNKMVRPRAVFFDIDGVLNELVDRGDKKTAPWNVSEFKFMPNVKEAVELVKKLSFKTYVITNQPDMYDGYMSKESLDLMMKMTVNWLDIDSQFCAFDRKSNLYKPNNGMIEYFINMYGIDRTESFIIGDRWKDIVAGDKSKLNTIFVGDEYTCPLEYEHIQPYYIRKNVFEACELIKELEQYD